MDSAVLDTCVLYPSLQRDLLLQLGSRGAYLPLWGRTILQELRRHERLKYIGAGFGDEYATARSKRLVAQMNEAFPESLLAESEDLVGSFGLPDADDEHVLAVAVAGEADYLITDNLRDFPRELVPIDIEIRTSAQFITDLVECDPDGAVEAMRDMARRNTRPRTSVDDLLRILDRREGLSGAVRRLRSVLS